MPIIKEAQRESIPAVVAPFAAVANLQTGIPSHTEFDELKNLFEAHDHIDFDPHTHQLPEWPHFRRRRLLHLPFMLAMGLHQSLYPTFYPPADMSATRFIAAAYVEEPPINVSAGVISTQKENAIRRLVCGAVLEAAVGITAIPRGYLDTLPRALRNEHLIDKAAARALKHAIDLVIE